jgi:hypothetical protein
MQTKSLDLKNNNKVAQIADMSVVAFIKVIAAIQKSHKLYKYRKTKLISDRIPNYSVKMGFGLHVGWAIEGAIGSEFKIDASYLSPNVNMASRLEAATRQFGVDLLISGKLFDILTPETAKNMRHIDTVTVKGSSEPMRLYTWDLDVSKLKIERDTRDNMSAKEKKAKKVQARIERNRYKEKVLNNQLKVSLKFDLDQDIQLMRSHVTPEFTEIFQKGFNWYINGEWENARVFLTEAENLKSPDNPSRLLISVMEEYGFRAPNSWKENLLNGGGCRKLTTK